MNRKDLLRIDILNMLLRFMIAFTLTSMFGLLYTNDATYVWKSLILFQATILSFVISKLTKHIWIYCVLHIALLLGYILIADDMVLKVLYTMYIAGYALFQFGLDIDGKIRNTPILFLSVLFFMFLICKYGYPKEVILDRVFFLIGLLFGIIYVLNRHQINFYYYLQKYEDKVNIPYKQINRSNRGFITVFIFLCSMSMIFFTKLPIGRLFYYIGLLLRNLLRAMLTGLTNTPPEVVEEESILPEEQMMEEELDYEVQAPSEFWMAVTKVLLVVTSALFVILIVTLIVYGLYKIYKMYYQTKGQAIGEEKVEVLSPFEKLDLGFIRGKRSVKSSIVNLFGRSNNEKIRKHYTKAVQKNTKSDKILKYYTPTELSQYAVDIESQKREKEVAKEAERTLTTIYEKARYSNSECSKEEVQSVKNIIK